MEQTYSIYFFQNLPLPNLIHLILIMAFEAVGLLFLRYNCLSASLRLFIISIFPSFAVFCFIGVRYLLEPVLPEA